MKCSFSDTYSSLNELKGILQIPSNDGVKSFLKRAKESQTLFNPFKGFRVLPHYDSWELACKMNPLIDVQGCFCETDNYLRAKFT
jgi:hypothetical protein